MIERPMRDMLLRASKRLSLHMPGGQGRAPFGRVNPYRLETTELPCTGDLYRPTGAIARAQALAAQSAGVAHTLLLDGGSTAGVHAMLLYAAQRGDTVIFPRNVHISAMNLCAMAGILPEFATPSYTPTGRPYTTRESYLRAMDANPTARAVFVVRPDYYGAMPELRQISQDAHARGMLVLCDEAHGAHFNWDLRSENAGACGADLFVQSAHKTLPALNAGAWLHAMAGVDAQRLLRALRMVQTSSPSFVTMLSLDDARAWMDGHGARACAKLRAALADFRARAARLGYKDAQDEPGMTYDPLRLALYAPQGGFRLADELSALKIDVEMCDERRIVCILSLLDGPKRLRRLLRALASLRADKPQNLVEPHNVDTPQSANHLGEAHGITPRTPHMAQRPYPPIPPRVLPLHQAAFAKTDAVALESAAGRVSAVLAGLYPPGVALVTPGERITPEIARALAALERSRVFGLTPNGDISCVSDADGDA